MALFYPDRLQSNNPSAYGIVKATEIAGHKTVQTINDLYTLADAILSDSGINENNDAIGQDWYVISENKKYRLINWERRKEQSGWQPSFDSKIDSEEQDTFSGQIGESTADRAISDELGNNIVNTYVTKKAISNYVVPSGGEEGQVLTKTQSGYDWKVLPEPKLSDNYAASVLQNDDLEPISEDTYETAISKLHGAILNNEEIVTDSLNNMSISIGLVNPNQELPSLSNTHYIKNQVSIVDCLKQLDTVLFTIASKIRNIESAVTLNNINQ